MLQKLAYLVVIFVLLPLIILMGLAMSPWLDAVIAGWVDLVGGRQSARTIHFIIAWLLVAFVFIHVFEVLISGAVESPPLDDHRPVSSCARRRAMNDHGLRGDRRRFLRRVLGGAGALVLAGCDRLSNTQWFPKLLGAADQVSAAAAHAVARTAMAQEFTPADLSPTFRSNGTAEPDNAQYRALAQAGFADYRLVVDGLVERPGHYSLADLRAMPARTQITRHDCVEGWSAIGKWQGARLAPLLRAVRPMAAARYVVFHCADPMEADGRELYYESIDLDDAYHEQTILAYELNDTTAAGGQWRADPAARRAPARLQAREVRDAARARRELRADPRRARRILGGPGLPVVRRHLKPPAKPAFY